MLLGKLSLFEYSTVQMVNFFLVYTNTMATVIETGQFLEFCYCSDSATCLYVFVPKILYQKFTVVKPIYLC